MCSTHSVTSACARTKCLVVCLASRKRPDTIVCQLSSHLCRRRLSCVDSQQRCVCSTAYTIENQVVLPTADRTHEGRYQAQSRYDSQPEPPVAREFLPTWRSPHGTPYLQTAVAQQLHTQSQLSCNPAAVPVGERMHTDEGRAYEAIDGAHPATAAHLLRGGIKRLNDVMFELSRMHTDRVAPYTALQQ